MGNAAEIKTYFAQPERSMGNDLRRDIDIVCKNPIVDGLLHTVSGLLAVLNSHRQIVSINDMFLRSLGVKNADDLLGLRPGEAVHCIHSHEMPGGCGTSQYCSTCGAAIAIVTSLATDTAQERKCVITAAKNESNEDICFRVKACPVNAGGNRYVLLFLQDITKEEWRASLERVFFHDLNNIITGLVGINELLNMNNYDCPKHLLTPLDHFVRRLDNEVKIQSILSRTASFEYHVVKEEIPVEDILHELEEIFRLHPVTAGKKLVFDAASRKTVFNSDRELLIRVFVNMIKNALEAAEENEEIFFRVKMAETEIVFSVWNRQAIPAEVSRRIFQRHFSTKKEDGRGFGTYSMKLLGERFLGGRVLFTTAPSEGTEFSIALPL